MPLRQQLLNYKYQTINYRQTTDPYPPSSSVLEEIVSIQINSFLEGNNIVEEIQSGFRKYHRTETALTKVIGDLRLTSSENKVSVLVLLDLSAAFCLKKKVFGSGFRPTLSIYVRPKLFYELGEEIKRKLEKE